MGCLRAFISTFLAGRTLRVRVRGAICEPRPVTGGVPQGSVLSPFLFNLVLAGLPATLPVDKRYPTLCSLYADDVALWVRGPRRNLTAIRRSLQRSLDAVANFFKAIGLVVSPTKTEALLVHPRSAARRTVRRLVLGDRQIPWSKAVTYLGLRIDHRLTWIPAAKLATFKATRVQTAVGKLLSRGQGCTPRLALRLYEGAATAVQTYALPLVRLAPHRKEDLERQHRMAIRRFLGLPRQSPVAATLAEAQAWPLSLLMLREALHHVDRLHRAPGGAALLGRLRSRPASRMGQICALYDELVPCAPCPIQPPPPHHQPLDVQLELDNVTKSRTPACELRQSAMAKLHDRLRGHLLVFTDGSVRDSPRSAAAACVIPTTGTTIRSRLPFHASSTAAELAGLHLAADYLAATTPQLPVAILCDSRPALQALLQPDQAGITVALLHAKLTAIRASGVRLSLHWLPSHVGIAGNEEADAAAKAAHHSDTPVTNAVALSDYSRQRLRQLLPTAHPDMRMASGKPPPPLPETGLERRERWLLLRLRTGSVWPAARMFSTGRCSSPACRRCGDEETLEHIICSCPALAAERRVMASRYRLLGLPATTAEDFLFPARSKIPALRAFLEFAVPADLAAL
uniref:Putative tick transposon n=1 Tax=Rhipicephalus pulchellus TaxID=72859 RepID=L7LZH7_RHIPC